MTTDWRRIHLGGRRLTDDEKLRIKAAEVVREKADELARSICSNERDPGAVVRGMQLLIEGKTSIVPSMSAGVPRRRRKHIFPPDDLHVRMSLAELIAAGRYDTQEGYGNEKCFPFEEDDIADGLEELHLGRELKKSAVEDEISRLGFVSAKLRGTLIWGARHPENQRNYPIVGLGSMGRGLGSGCSPHLMCDNYERCLAIDWCGYLRVFEAHWRFLVRRKS